MKTEDQSNYVPNSELIFGLFIIVPFLFLFSTLNIIGVLIGTVLLAPAFLIRERSKKIDPEKVNVSRNQILYSFLALCILISIMIVGGAFHIITWAFLYYPISFFEHKLAKK